MHTSQRLGTVAHVARRAFGTTRRHRSGRWGAEYPHPVTRQRVTAGRSFATKAEALRWLAEAEVDLSRGQLLDPAGIKRSFGDYSTAWLAGRTDLRPKTAELYEYLHRTYLLPHLAHVKLGEIEPATVRWWHGTVSQGTQSPVTTAKAYRLLRQVLAAAVIDSLLRSNPCSLRGAAVERSAERKIPSFSEVVELAGAVRAEYRLMVLLGALAGLRRGECLALRRRDLVQRDGVWTVTIEASIVYIKGEPTRQAPKTSAGVRHLALPAILGDAIEEHLAEFGPIAADAPLFVDSHTGSTPTLMVWRGAWEGARKATSLDYTFHDLRHLAGTLNAAAGASIREAMARMGHASPRAALRYQHVVERRDGEVAQSIDRLLRSAP